MGKIWIKSADPNRQCCECEIRAEGPCAACCEGIIRNLTTTGYTPNLYNGNVYGVMPDLRQPHFTYLGPQNPSGSNCYVANNAADSYTLSGSKTIVLNAAAQNAWRPNALAVSLAKNQELEITTTTTWSSNDSEAFFYESGVYTEAAKHTFQAANREYSGTYIYVSRIDNPSDSSNWGEIIESDSAYYSNGVQFRTIIDANIQTGLVVRFSETGVTTPPWAILPSIPAYNPETKKYELRNINGGDSGFFNFLTVAPNAVQRCTTFTAGFMCTNQGGYWQWFFNPNITQQYPAPYDDPNIASCTGAMYNTATATNAWNNDAPERDIGFVYNLYIPAGLSDPCGPSNPGATITRDVYYEAVNYRATAWPKYSYNHVSTRRIKFKALKSACIAISAGVGGNMRQTEGLTLRTGFLNTVRANIAVNTETILSSNKNIGIIPLKYVTGQSWAQIKVDCPFASLP